MLNAAQALLDQRGFAAVTMDDVARAAGVSRQAVYLHFGSRSGLLVALARHTDEVDPPFALYQRFGEAEDAEAMLDAGLDIHLHFEARIHDYALELKSIRSTDPAAQAAWDDRMAARRAGLARLAARLLAEGSLQAGWTESEAVDFLFALLSVDNYQTLVVELGWAVERYRDRMRATILSTLFTSGARTR